MAEGGVYAEGSLVGSDKDWFHGELTTVEAEQALRASGYDCFLVRKCQGALVLSLIHHGELHHINIKYGPGWYALENGSSPYSFTELEDLVTYYCSYTISENLKIRLDQVCEKNKGIIKAIIIAFSKLHIPADSTYYVGQVSTN